MVAFLNKRIRGLALAAVALAYVVGCNESPTASPAAVSPDKAQNKMEREHPHKPGPNGGMIVPIGRDNYHAEPVFAKDGMLRLHILGKDESRPQEVESQSLTVYVKAEETTESTAIILQPAPQPGDAKGKTSVFVGKLPQDLWARNVTVTVPSITIAGERFRFGFENRSATHDGGMPEKTADAEEKQLYLTPGGKYTAADIKANGNMTASQKFKGFKARHDLRPKAGDKICPVTRTKANPKCTWIVGGKTYEFCCPPCVDEFLKQAKESPAEIKSPEAYVART